MTLRYFSFIDGLRALSILAVVGCHVRLPGFAGGFVGVDVFFVISGFLIINQIKEGLEAEQFSWVTFYARRTLRILPAFIAMILAVYLVAPFFLPNPDVSLDFIRSAVLSPLMLSNVLFYKRQGYFDISADEKPLLHTWTLSVEEQFYLLSPILLMLVFRLGGRRFGVTTVLIALALAALSLSGAIAFTTVTDSNAAFYLVQWRIWEFVLGGLIGDTVVQRLRCLPRAAFEISGVIGALGILLAITMFTPAVPYPSWRALLPVVGATLIIVSALAEPRILICSLLSLRWMVGIGLISYGWYLWHWPIISFLRISRMDEPSMGADLIGGGLGGFLLATVSYLYLERPIRKWRRAKGGVIRPGRIFLTGVSACVSAAIIGGLSGLGGYLWISHYAASVYGIDGKGSFDNGCRLINSTSIPGPCLTNKVAILLGDSHADTMFSSLARSFHNLGTELIYVGRGGCNPLYFAISERKNNRHHLCANLLGPFEQLIMDESPVVTVVVTPTISDNKSLDPELWAELISQFSGAKTRILLIAPSPTFKRPALDCVLLSDRYGESRDHCTSARSVVDAERAGTIAAMKQMPLRFANVHFIDPIDLFCDSQLCKPFDGNVVYFSDGTHLETSGTDLIYDRFEREFRWVAWQK
jgi:peptidoglycan/LPS O-acetylase OafA/YrhL